VATASWAEAAAAWPSPSAHDGNGTGEHGQGGLDLRTKVEEWQTPASDSFRSRGGERKDEQGLDQQARIWQTPNGQNFTSRKQAGDTERQPLLDQQATQWASPKSRDWKGGLGAVERQSPDLDKQAEHYFRPDPETPKHGSASSESAPTSHQQWITPRTENVKGSTQRLKQGSNESVESQAKEMMGPRKRLNPTFVSWLMGWPEGWLDLHNSASQETASYRCRLRRRLRYLLGASDGTCSRDD